MTTRGHVAQAIGSTCSDAPAYRVEVRTGRHRLVADELPTLGGGDLGPSPFGLLLSGLASCTAATLRMYAERKGWELTRITMDVRYYIDEDGTASIKRNITIPRDCRPSGGTGSPRSPSGRR